MRVVILLLVVTIAAVLATPPRPQIPNTFSAEATIEVLVNKTHGHKAVGQGYWAVDEEHSREVERFEFDGKHHHHRNYITLALFDECKGYEVKNKECTAFDISGPMQSPWEWVEKASYLGKKEIRHHEYDLWGLSDAEKKGEIAVAVLDTDPNTPAALFSKHGDRDVSVLFNSFKAHTPDASKFDVPKECKQ